VIRSIEKRLVGAGSNRVETWFNFTRWSVTKEFLQR
jgi:hypothetical protein